MAFEPIQGFFFPAGGSASVGAILELVEGRLQLRHEGGAITQDPAGVRISGRIGNIPRRFEFPDGSRFETHENDLVDRLEADLGRRFSWAFRLESNWSFALSCAGVLLAFLLLGYFVLLPAASRSVAKVVPASLVGHLAGSTEHFLERAYLSESRLEGEKAQRVAGAFSRCRAEFPEMKLQLHIRAGGALGANALALPNGSIYVTDALAELAESEEDLLAVLFHEVGHVSKRHSLIHLLESSALTLGIVLIGGADWVNIPMLILGSAYSRDHETEADVFAAERLRKLGLPTSHLANMLLRLQEKQEGFGAEFSFLSTHPGTADRAKRLRETP